MDLNLIRVFTAVYEERTVTSAARRLHMSQPSVTQALHRLRREAGDALFVRAGRGIAPTRSAHQLYREVGHLPASAESAIRKLTRFEPSTTVETFRLALTDLGQSLFLPTVYPVVAEAAPGCTIEVVNLDIDTAPGDLEAGRIDLAIASTLLAGDLRTSVVRDDVYCCIVRRGRFGDRTPSFDELCALPRIVARNALGHALLESQMPPAPPRSVYLPAFAAVPAMVAAADLIAFVPEGIVGEWASRWPLESWPLPRDQFASVVRAHTARTPTSIASAWFAELVVDTVRGINAVEAPRGV